MDDEMTPMQDVRIGQAWRYSNEEGSMDVFVLGPSKQYADLDCIWDVEVNHPGAILGASYPVAFVEEDRGNWELLEADDV